MISSLCVCVCVCVCMCVRVRLLGSTEVKLQEVVSRGKQSITSTLKGKKGDMLNVSTACIHLLV